MVARTHKTLIWERTRHVLRLRHALREYFPAALEAFDDLDAPDTLELLGKAPDPAPGREADPRADQRRAQARPPPRHRRPRPPRSWPRCAASSWASRGRSPPPTRPPSGPLIAVITTLNEQVKTLQGQVEAHFGRHPDAEIYLSQPGLGADPRRPGARRVRRRPQAATPTRKARKNYAGTSPITRASGQEEDRRSPGSSTTTGSSTRSCPGLLRAARLARRPRLLRRAPRPRTSNTTPRCASSPTGSSASCTAA